MMKVMKLRNLTKNHQLSEEVWVADTFLKRFVGLMGRKGLPENTCLWIKRCPSVHTFFMRFAIDIVFINKSLQVTKVYKNLTPWNMTALFSSKNDSCFEFQAGALNVEIEPGDQLDVHS